MFIFLFTIWEIKINCFKKGHYFRLFFFWVTNILKYNCFDIMIIKISKKFEMNKKIKTVRFKKYKKRVNVK